MIWQPVKGHDGYDLTADGPFCGEDFCDGCGDCLYCYGNDWCPNGGHTWIVYDDELEEFYSRHARRTVGT
jgi:hypothetical protein